jgi:hypothetical protein
MTPAEVEALAQTASGLGPIMQTVIAMGVAGHLLHIGRQYWSERTGGKPLYKSDVAHKATTESLQRHMSKAEKHIGGLADATAGLGQQQKLTTMALEDLGDDHKRIEAQLAEIKTQGAINSDRLGQLVARGDH